MHFLSHLVPSKTQLRKYPEFQTPARNNHTLPELNRKAERGE